MFKKYLNSLLFLVFIFAFVHCGAGTQVLSPSNPSEAPVPTAFRVRLANYQFSGILPSGWTFNRFTSASNIPAGVYNDTNPNTLLEAALGREGFQFSLFTFPLANDLPIDQSLARFVRTEYALEDFDVQRDPDSEIPAFTAVLIDPSSTLTHIVMDVYYAAEGLGVKTHFEISGTREQILAIGDEFVQVVDSYLLEE